MRSHNPITQLHNPADEAAWFAHLVDAVAPACVVVDPGSDRILAANAAAARLYGAAPLAGRSFLSLHPASVPDLLVFAEEVAYRGAAWTRRLEARRPDGKVLSLEYEAAASDAGAGRRLVFVAADLGERARRDRREEAGGIVHAGLLEWRRLERLARQAARLNDLILTSAGDGIYGVDRDGLTTFVNPAAEAMLGWSAADLIGRSMHEMIHHHHADGSVYPAGDCPIYNAFRHAKVNRVDDEYFWRKDGRPLRVEYTSTPIVEDETVQGAVIVFRDITTRKENERRLIEATEEVARLKRRLEMENAYLQEEIRESRNHNEIIGISAAIAETVRQIELVAPTDANVVIIGESGTGKELVAQAIHQDSTRADRPLIRVNCAAVPRDLFESEFFGHVKGAFTGALRDRIGRFELADGGTLFLDEVGEIPVELQSKLLRVLQEGSFERVGAAETRQIDVRVIAATNRDLSSEVAAGRFREDLYFRLNVFPIRLVPLRERPEDIAPLAEHFLKLSARRLNVPIPTLSNANVDQLRAYSWPGNARELQNVVERAVILAQGGRLGFDVSNAPGPAAAQKAPAPAAIETEAARRAAEIENMRAALEACGGKVSGPDGAAALLGLKPSTLYSRLRRLGLKG
ncbi:sigma 54-interacting transcriptional regulator [Paralimibaculum aggregatum]|uniref:Sigma 54-interacting transcriptional regulator n=1 Tax=Paralimibaculum aggregatum TaxID=3036245 RepID=A0ABQ6LKB7_9RHOB|nr:sigma 54-interacting transcriptional regulator [Limibaculum sp. NKW23]GMG82659.1 sigma 54-interacting transcriptional regulator [Limibaculum sp. NKW23]